MALKGKYLISNGSKASITVGAITVKPLHVVEVEIDVEAHPQYLAELISKGCGVTLGSLTNASGSVADDTAKVTTAVDLAQDCSTILASQIRNAVSVAGDGTYSEYGE